MPAAPTQVHQFDAEFSHLQDLHYGEFLVRSGPVAARDFENCFQSSTPQESPEVIFQELVDEKLLQENHREECFYSFTGKQDLLPGYLAKLFTIVQRDGSSPFAASLSNPGFAGLSKTMSLSQFLKCLLFATAYGNSDWPISAQILLDVQNVAQFNSKIAATTVEWEEDVRAVEKALVWSVSLPAAANAAKATSNERWEKANDVLRSIIQRVISPAVRWVGSRGFHYEGPEYHEWVTYEIISCAEILRGALLSSCNCWERWADFCIANEKKAREHCERHVLSAWDSSAEKLWDFLFTALVHGDLRLAGNEKPEIAKANDFRRGMLAKALSSEDGRQLQAGRTLRCRESDCSGEIAFNDKCSSCGKISSGYKEPQWWLFPKSDYQQVLARRCYHSYESINNEGKSVTISNGCQGWFFQYRGGCPNCGQRFWSRRLTRIWHSVGHTGVHDGMTNAILPLDQQTRSEELEKLIAQLDDELTELARLVLSKELGKGKNNELTPTEMRKKLNISKKEYQSRLDRLHQELFDDLDED